MGETILYIQILFIVLVGTVPRKERFIANVGATRVFGFIDGLFFQAWNVEIKTMLEMDLTLLCQI